MKPKRTHCIRCGECCLKSSPTLQLEDVGLVLEGDIPYARIYTIRRGEMVRDNVQEKDKPADSELVKVREKGARQGGGCVYYDEKEKACAIYEQRPVQCAALQCWDTGPFMAVYRRPKAERKDLLRDKTLLHMIKEHEARCSYEELGRHVNRIPEEGEPAVQRILKMLEFDYELRPLMSRKMGIDPAAMDFILGRPLMETIPMFGLKVIREPDNTFCLTVAG